jgi:hypothetical protein
VVEKREIVEAAAAGDDVVMHQNMREGDTFTPETDDEAERDGPDQNWKFWDEQIKAGLIHERRWRHQHNQRQDRAGACQC